MCITKTTTTPIVSTIKNLDDGLNTIKTTKTTKLPQTTKSTTVKKFSTVERKENKQIKS